MKKLNSRHYVKTQTKATPKPSKGQRSCTRHGYSLERSGTSSVFGTAPCPCKTARPKQRLPSPNLMLIPEIPREAGKTRFLLCLPEIELSMQPRLDSNVKFSACATRGGGAAGVHRHARHFYSSFASVVHN